jgi:class 3 adenylate cyclase
MEFVNSIARIVHTSVAIHGGAANKNIGDAFLLVRQMRMCGSCGSCLVAVTASETDSIAHT